MALYFNMNKPEQKKPSLLFWCLALSIVFHLGLMFKRANFKSETEIVDVLKSNEPIEIAKLPPEVMSPPVQQTQPPAPVKTTKEKQLAETEDAKNREIDPNAQFLGEHNQKATKQTKASRIDDFREKQGTGEKGLRSEKLAALPPTQEEGKAETQENELGREGEGVTAEPKSKKGVKRNWKTLSLKDLSVGGDGGAEAASDDHLKNVDSGQGTVLSTREFRFYSYYHRIKELLRQYWKPNVERQIARIWNKGRNITKDELTTKLVVLLDKTGKIEKISKVGGSGFSELDEAAIEAFQKAGPFPNPPKGMVDSDGFVRIQWDFILQTDSSPSISWRSYGSAPY